MPRLKRGLVMQIITVERVWGGGLLSEKVSFMLIMSSRYMLSLHFMRWSSLEWMHMGCRSCMQ